MLCPHYGKCGGCQMLDVPYEKQIEYKIKLLINLFGKEPSEIYKSPKIRFYRNRMDYVVGPEYKVGLKEKGKWWAYVDISECLLQSEESNKIRNLFREFIKEKKMEPWDTIKHKGFVRYIVIREGKFTNGRMVIVILSKREREKEFLEFYNEISDITTSFYLGIHEGLSDVSYAEEYIHLAGDKYLKEKLLDLYLYICPSCFYQSNSYTAEILVKKVLEFADLKGNEVVYDLYSGIGAFSLHLAKYSKAVYAVEMVGEAIYMLNLNKEENGIKNVEGIVSKVEDLDKIRGDIVVLDPPRAGMHPKAVKKILESDAKRIVYVSCNPKTQKRDIEMLSKKYELVDYIFVDQFPNTFHMETIALLEKKI